MINGRPVLAKTTPLTIAQEKNEGPTQCMTFLGHGLDTVSQTIFVPRDKVDKAVSAIDDLLTRNKLC